MSKTIQSFIEALEIIAKHSPKGMDEEYFFEPGHDIICSNIEVDEVTEASIDGQRLQELGWHVDTEIDVWVYFT